MISMERSQREYSDVSVIIAAFNEESSIAKVVRRVFLSLPGAEVLVVHGGTDGTSRVVQSLASELPRLRLVPNLNDRGKGHAIRVGIAHASGEVHAQIDADLQFLPEELPRLVDPILNQDADITLGSRFMPGSVREPGSTPLVRTLGNLTAGFYASLSCRHRITDPQAGIKAWTRAAIQQIGLKSDNYSYEAEIAVKGVFCGTRVLDIPVTTLKRFTGITNVNVLIDGLRLLWDITRFWYEGRIGQAKGQSSSARG